ncbi:MAG: CapA family protein [Caldilineaceae bacterium]|nr:CapA family protein [Caldilineaceae bacterium]
MIPLKPLSHRVAMLLSLVMILGGASLLLWLLFNLPGATAGETRIARAVSHTPEAVEADDGTSITAALTETLPTPTPNALVLDVADGVPAALTSGSDPALVPTALAQTAIVTAATTAADVTVRLDYQQANGQAIYAYTFAAAARFDTIDTELTWDDVQAAWRGQSERFPAVVVLTDTLPALAQVLGTAGANVVGYATEPEVVTAAWVAQTAPATSGARPLVLLPFEQLEPRLVVFAIDGQNPVENANKFTPADYPLVATVYAHDLSTTPAEQKLVQDWLQALPAGNRNADHLTVLAMTGVTAMVRLTAEQMDQRGAAWVAEVVGPELATADITVISNEVPFVEGCETDTRMDNLTFCSKPDYLVALTDSGVDIIGLTGNHQNDYGREDALQSLAFYEKNNLPVYGGGRNKEAAFAPYYLEHNGNRLAFLGANSYGPTFAWATDDKPGSAQFDLNIMSATIRNIKAQDRADLVLAELQYQESYDVTPLYDQRQNFNALVRAGADIVTGVQSHVPQAMEFTEGKLVLYGLGNLFFDQMWSQATREGMIVKHTIYEGRHLSTQVLTTLLYDYGQPRWTTPEERTTLLRRVYGASYWEK